MMTSCTEPVAVTRSWSAGERRANGSQGARSEKRVLEALQRRAAETVGIINFAGGLPTPRSFPRARLAAAFVRALQQPSCPALQYGWPEGSEDLRAWIAEQMRRRGAAVAAEDVIVTSGAQQAISLATQAIAGGGSRIGVDAESYPGALDIFRARGLLPVRDRASVDAYYLMPAVSNPRGNRMSAAERAAVIGTSKFIIEDDAYADLCFDDVRPTPLLSVAPDRVFHIGTFSKTLCPGLRVGWVVPPPRMRRKVLELKQAADLQAGSLAQAVLQDYLREEDFDGRLARLRKLYGRRAARLGEALRRHVPSFRFQPPVGGFAVWVEPDGQPDEAEFLSAAIDHGVAFDPGSLFRADGAARPAAVRLCFSALARDDEIDEGARRLARCWAALQKHSCDKKHR